MPGSKGNDEKRGHSMPVSEGNVETEGKACQVPREMLKLRAKHARFRGKC